MVSLLDIRGLMPSLESYTAIPHMSEQTFRKCLKLKTKQFCNRKRCQEPVPKSEKLLVLNR